MVFVGSESNQRTSNSSSFEKIIIKEPQRTIGLHEIGNQETISSFIEGYLTSSLSFLVCELQLHNKNQFFEKHNFYVRYGYLDFLENHIYLSFMTTLRIVGYQFPFSITTQHWYAEMLDYER